MQELSVRFHGEEKIGDAMFRMFRDSAALPQVIDALILEPLMLTPIIIAVVARHADLSAGIALASAFSIAAGLAVWTLPETRGRELSD